MSYLTPFSNPDEVLQTIKHVTERIHLGLHKLLPETRRAYFEKRGFPVDKALHAMLTRFELKHHLILQQILAENEEEVDGGHYSIRAVSNCGLIVHASNCVLRILKWHDRELPSATSNERCAFYQHNLFAFETNDPHPDKPMPPLNLVAAWDATEDHELATLSLVCPWGETDNKVHSKWWRTLELPPVADLGETLPPEPALDEITAKEEQPQLHPQAPNTSGRNDEIPKSE